MKNRSYLGDGVYASFDTEGSVVLELETRNKITLNKEVFHTLIEYIHKNKVMFDPHCQLIEVPHQLFPQVVGELRELEAAVEETRKDVKPTH